MLMACISIKEHFVPKAKLLIKEKFLERGTAVSQFYYYPQEEESVFSCRDDLGNEIETDFCDPYFSIEI